MVEAFHWKATQACAGVVSEVAGGSIMVYRAVELTPKLPRRASCVHVPSICICLPMSVCGVGATVAYHRLGILLGPRRPLAASSRPVRTPGP